MLKSLPERNGIGRKTKQQHGVYIVSLLPRLIYSLMGYQLPTTVRVWACSSFPATPKLLNDSTRGLLDSSVKDGQQQMTDKTRGSSYIVEK